MSRIDLKRPPFYARDASTARASVARASDEPLRFHRALPGYEVTPLVDLPEIARACGVARLLAKLETQRFGLPAFKVVGVTWAVARLLAVLSESTVDFESPIRGMQHAAAQLPGLTFTAATEGNHGRAVARTAKMVGAGARIYMSKGAAQARVDAVRREGAEVVIVQGSYDDAVLEAREQAEQPGCELIADTAHDELDLVPRWIVEGYSTIFGETEAQLAALGVESVDVAFLQMGVGSFAAAGIRALRSRAAPVETLIIGVEPVGAACVTASLHEGRRVAVPPPHASTMGGLNCGTVCASAWRDLRDGLDASMWIDDDQAALGARALLDVGIEAGMSGAVGTSAALWLARAIARSDAFAQIVQERGFDDSATVLVVVTEGATDPVTGRRVSKMPSVVPPASPGALAGRPKPT